MIVPIVVRICRRAPRAVLDEQIEDAHEGTIHRLERVGIVGVVLKLLKTLPHTRHMGNHAQQIH